MKKKFKDTKVGQFLVGKGGVFSSLTDSIPDKGLLGLVKNLINKDDTLPFQDKETALKLLEMDNNELIEITKRWESDNKSDSSLAYTNKVLNLLTSLIINPPFFFSPDSVIISGIKTKLTSLNRDCRISISVFIADDFVVLSSTK